MFRVCACYLLLLLMDRTGNNAGLGKKFYK